MKCLSKYRDIDGYLVVLFMMALIFFAIYSYLPFVTDNAANNINGLIFNSPDETANYWAAANYADTGNFTEFSEASLYGGDIVKPRSLRVIDNYLVPTGFLGMAWLYGTIARIASTSVIIPYLTPFFAVMGVLFFYLSLRFLFTKKISWLSAALLFVHPAFWYYATRSMMPNVLFISLLIAAIYFFLRAVHQDKTIWYVLSGVILGLSLMVRASEVIWVFPLFVLLCAFYYKKINWTSVWLVPIMTLAGLIPLFYYNYILFDNPFSLGYQLQASSEFGGLGWLTYVLPFGFDMAVIKLHVMSYLRDIFNWYYISIIIGIVLTVISLYKCRRKYWMRLLGYIIALDIVAFILIVYYGSWQFSDNPDPSAITIGTSFVRYWLPIYILTLPLIGIPIGRLFRKSTIAWALISCSILIVSTVFAYGVVYNDNQEGIKAVSSTISGYQEISTKVVNSTEDNAIIIAKKSDKIFFPRRAVIYDLFYEVDYNRVADLAAVYPVYMWDWQYNETVVATMNEKLFGPANLIIEPLEVKGNNMILYKVNINEN